MSGKLATRPISSLFELDPSVQLVADRATEVSFIPMADVSDHGEWETRQTRKLIEVATGYTRFAEGDVLFAKITPCMENGKGAHATGLANGVGFGSTEFYVLRAHEGVDSRFVYHWTRSPKLRRKAEAFMIGSAGQQRVRPEFFEQFAVVDISLPEQRKIAAILDTVDAAIRQTEATIAKLQQMKQGLLHDLLTRGIDDNGELRDPVRHPEQFQDTPLGRIPKGWEVSSFHAVIEGIDAGKSPDYPDFPAPPGEWGVLKVGAVGRRRFSPNENKQVTRTIHQDPRYEIRDGDLLISRANTYELVGLACVVRDAPPRLMLSDKTLRIRLKPSRALAPYFEMLLGVPYVRRQIEIHSTGTSGSMKNISQAAISTLCVAYPDVEEQVRMLESLNSLRDEEGRLHAERAKLSQLKHGLMDDLLTGRVSVAV